MPDRENCRWCGFDLVVYNSYMEYHETCWDEHKEKIKNLAETADQRIALLERQVEALEKIVRRK